MRARARNAIASRTRRTASAHVKQHAQLPAISHARVRLRGRPLLCYLSLCVLDSCHSAVAVALDLHMCSQHVIHTPHAKRRNGRGSGSGSGSAAERCCVCACRVLMLMFAARLICILLLPAQWSACHHSDVMPIQTMIREGPRRRD